MKTFSLLALNGPALSIVKTGSFDEVQNAMGDAVASSEEEVEFQIVRVYGTANGGLRNGQPV